MRLALISLLMIPLALGCEDWGWGSCEVDCDDLYDDCMEGNKSESACDAELSKCKRGCAEAREERSEDT